ncbi:hypothetical protein BUALT_Bualt07G0011700 [Buddleja alternifolia]|uniref:Leucine-rich repeat-containing N-terminal plant-type domain-containing protein n=1 Tax=Buddleja alternifolia TaxID=168488 RepID=A0AAV6XF76_9LAMI|nr:hypothetical protein BUALT_Bualt07G0011700 [Buddleja alternifolia]
MIIGHCLQVRCLERERAALVKFRDQLIDVDGRLSSWSTQEDCCKWEGVHCHNKTNHVTRLHLPGSYPETGINPSRLEGTISHSLLELHHLSYLDLSYNNFRDARIPDFIGSLTELQYLNLSYNYFFGQIPHNLGNLSKLLYLDLNRIGGYSENLDWLSHLYSLRYLALDYVNLSKGTDWLQAISKLSYIEELHLWSCRLPDIVPSSLPYVNASSPLAFLDLSSNNLTLVSTIPWFSNFSKVLSSIDLSGNNFLGPIPDDAFKDMKSLSYLHLSDCGIEGGIPKSLGNVTTLISLDLQSNGLNKHLSEIMMNISHNKLQCLDLSFNNITGPLPNFSRFSLLKTLDIHYNHLNGSIPKGYLQLPHLVNLSLRSNKITGPIPDLSFCSSMRNLILDENLFNGTFTQTIAGMFKLERLSIVSNLLEGIITENHLTNFSQLNYLDLSYNSLVTMQFSSHWVPPFQVEELYLEGCKLGPEFPKWLRTQKQLRYLDISSAQISDTIPNWFGNQSLSLVYLNASCNQIYGFFPDNSFSMLNFNNQNRIGPALDLSRNQISGSVSFLCGRSILTRLIDLSDNLFSGQVPDCFANFQSLTYLNLANNGFTGLIPNSCGFLPNIKFLHLRNNSFSGPIPISMMNCTNLRTIDFGKNRLIGEIPTWFGFSLLHLEVLSLHQNEFYGTIPSNLCELRYVQVLDLSSNNLSGVIPKCLQNLTSMTRKDGFNYFESFPYSVFSLSIDGVNLMWKGTEVEYKNGLRLVKLIDLSSNNLVGKIPSEITKLDDLVGLNLSRNKLTGSIPQDIGRMVSLNFLDLSRNHLSGGVPTSLSELNGLGVLNLSYNNLSGKIPQDTHMVTFNELSYTGNPGLCGRPLIKSCPGDETRQDPKHTPSDDDDSDDNFITQGFYIAMGLGFGIAFGGIFGTILFNRSSRHAYFQVLNRVEDYVYVRVELMKARLRRTPQNE